MKFSNEYSKKHQLLNLTIQKFLNNEKLLVISHNQNTKKCKLKLPMLELTKFRGEIKNWLTFWGQFRKMYDGTFQYLLHVTILNSRAREIVGRYPPILC